MTVRLLATLSLTGCFRTVTFFECDDTATPVPDTEETPGGTAADLLDALSGSGTAEGLLLDEDLVGVTWTVERGEGSAEWIESVTVSRKERAGGLGFGTTVFTSSPDCHDRLEVPIVVSVVTDDGALDVAVETVAESRPDLGGVQTNVYGHVAYEEATFPSVPHVSPEAFDDKEAFVRLNGLDTDGVSGKAGWEGSQITETSNSASAHYILEFPVPDT
jgi:hypothetical protein